MSPLGFLVVADLVQLLESASRQQVEVAGFRWGGGRRRRALVNRLLAHSSSKYLPGE